MIKIDQTLTAAIAAIGLMLAGGGCGTQVSSKPVPITPSPGAAPGDYTAQLRQSAQMVQSAQHTQTSGQTQ